LKVIRRRIDEVDFRENCLKSYRMHIEMGRERYPDFLVIIIEIVLAKLIFKTILKKKG